MTSSSLLHLKHGEPYFGLITQNVNIPEKFSSLGAGIPKFTQGNNLMNLQKII